MAGGAVSAEASVPAGISGGSWSQVREMVADGKNVQFTSGGEGKVPDYILGADGKLTANPNKQPSADGSVVIQVEKGGKEASSKAAQQLQIAAVNEKISYWRRANPGSADIPGFLKGELASAQSAGSSPQGDSSPQQRQPEQPQQQMEAPASRASSGGSGSNYGLGSSGGERVGSANIGTAPTSHREGSFEPNGPMDRSAVPRPVEGDLPIKGPPTSTPDQIQTFLEKMGSPAAREPGFSQALHDACTNRGIDPSVAVGFFLQESTCGRNGRAHENHSLGNIKGQAPESGGSSRGFRAYETWAEGARDWARLIDESYVQKRGCESLSQVLNIYAPTSDGNNVNGYVATVKGVVEDFKKQNQA